MSRTQGEILRAALAHLEVAQSYAARDPDDQVVVDAICLRLSAAVERLASLDLAVREEIFGSDWPLMWGMRNRIAHGYELVHADIIRATLSQDVPGIIQSIRGALGHGDDNARGDLSEA